MLFIFYRLNFRQRKCHSPRQLAHHHRHTGPTPTLTTRTGSYVGNVADGAMCSDGSRTVLCVIWTKREPNLIGINVGVNECTNEMYECRIKGSVSPDF
jgi:hypothetical protein